MTSLVELGALPRPEKLIMETESRSEDENEHITANARAAEDPACIRCVDGHLKSMESGDNYQIPNSNLCPCCHQALTSFSSWIAGDVSKASPSREPSTTQPSQFPYPNRIESFVRPHHRDFRDLQTAVENYGCRLCSLLMGPYSHGPVKIKRDKRFHGPLSLKFEATIPQEYESSGGSRRHLTFNVRLGTKRRNDLNSMLQLIPLNQPGLLV